MVSIETSKEGAQAKSGEAVEIQRRGHEAKWEQCLRYRSVLAGKEVPDWYRSEKKKKKKKTEEKDEKKELKS